MTDVDVRRAAWRSALEGVLAWRPGTDPEPVLSALGLALVLDLTGELDDVPGTARVKTRGREALMAASFDDDDAVWASTVARAGLSVLEHRPLGTGVGDLMHPPPGRLADMLRGEPDGLAAGSCAAHVHRCSECAAAVRTLVLASDGRSAPLAVAAENVPTMRDPAGGRVLAKLDSPSAEIVLFETPAPPRLAVYADASVPVRLEAEAVVTEHMLTGYWLGRTEPDADRITGTLHIGDQSTDIDLPL